MNGRPLDPLLAAGMSISGSSPAATRSRLRCFPKMRLRDRGKERHVRGTADRVGMHAVLVVERAIVRHVAIGVLHEPAKLAVAKVQHRSVLRARDGRESRTRCEDAPALQLIAELPALPRAPGAARASVGADARRAPSRAGRARVRSTIVTSIRTSRGSSSRSASTMPRCNAAWCARAHPPRRFTRSRSLSACTIWYCASPGIRSSAIVS